MNLISGNFQPPFSTQSLSSPRLLPYKHIKTTRTMNIKRNIFAVLAATVLLASCSQDEVMTDTGPDGLVPVTLSAAVGDGVQTRTIDADNNENPTRCYVQAFTTVDNGTTLTPAPGDLARPLDMGEPTAEGTFSLANVYLNPNETYVFLYWADNVEKTDASEGLNDLRFAVYDNDSIAWAKRSEIWKYQESEPTEITAELKHVVAKVTLKTTTNVEAGSKITVTVPITYTTYKVDAEAPIMGLDDTDNTPFVHTVTSDITGTKDGTEVFSFYALVDEANQDLTLTNGTNSQQVTNVPLAPNMHTTLVGDVQNIGLTDVTFTASIDKKWDDTKTEIIGLEIADDVTYIVSSPAALQAWAKEAQSDPSLNCTLADDITLPVVTDGGSNWTPIQGYMGTFDGGGKTITGLTINKSTGSNVGLFASIAEGGTVKNLKLDDVDITAGSNVGAIAGENRGTIENCSVSGSVTGLSDNSFLGGIAGWHREGTITDCHSSATVTGKAYVGGIAGQSSTIVGTTTITACYSTGSVTATKNNTNCSFAGGVVGLNSNGAILTACYATGNVKGDGDYVGGVVGDNSYGTVTACYHATGDVTGASGSTSTGGVAGRNCKDDYGSSTLTACYWDNNQSSGIGEDQTNKGEATKVDGDWAAAKNAMNTALTGTGWQYVASSGDIPLTLQRQN